MDKHSDQISNNQEANNHNENLLPREENLNMHKDFDQIEKDLNDRIMEVTSTIQDQYPELIKYLDEIPLTIPSDKEPEVTINMLRSYHESLVSMLNEYKQKIS